MRAALLNLKEIQKRKLYQQRRFVLLDPKNPLFEKLDFIEIDQVKTRRQAVNLWGRILPDPSKMEDAGLSARIMVYSEIPSDFYSNPDALVNDGAGIWIDLTAASVVVKESIFKKLLALSQISEIEILREYPEEAGQNG